MTELKKLLAAGACVAAIVAAPAAAVAQTPRTTTGTATVYYSVTPQDLEPLLKGEGYQTKIMPLENGESVITVDPGSKGGPKFGVFFEVCKEAGFNGRCLGMRLFALFGVDADDMGTAGKIAADWNSRYAFGKGYTLSDSNDVALEFYAITDEGVTREHLFDVILEFQAAAVEFEKQLRAATN